MRPAAVLAAVLAGIGILVLVYSQTIAFTWDAGFHLLAAQMINAGKRPYIDFCFPQTPLNAWWMAFWMRVFGQTWRVPQALAALAMWGAVILAATFVFDRFPVARWRVPAAVATAVLLAFNELVLRFGTISQAYAICMFLTVAAFRVAVGTPYRPGPWRPAAVGLMAGAAAGCTLLSAMAAPALLAWIVYQSRKGNRWVKGAAFAMAAAIPFLPVARLFMEGPNQTWFNVFQYQLAYRHAVWGNTFGHDLAQMTTWLDSTQAFVLFLLAISSWWFIRGPECDARLRSELYLCGWLGLALGLEVTLARPTFARYFVLGAPFVAILAGAGFYVAVMRLRGPQSGTLVPTLLLTILILMGAAREIYDEREVYRWKDLEKVAARIRQVAPPHAVMYAEEPIYFLLHTDPPEGMQFAYSRELELPPAQSAQLHIVSQKIMDQRVAAGAFDLVEVCLDQETVDRLNLKTLYRKTEQVEYCDLFWDRAPH
jgi:hypothetical protein